MRSADKRALKIMAEGGRIEARRTYPHGYHFWLAKKDGTRYASDLPDQQINDLVVAGFILALEPTNHHRDTFDYVITPAGLAAFRMQPATEDDGQLCIPGTEAK